MTTFLASGKDLDLGIQGPWHRSGTWEALDTCTVTVAVVTLSAAVYEHLLCVMLDSRLWECSSKQNGYCPSEA